MDRVIGTFLEFKTEETLPESWVKTVWLDNGFTRYIPFSAEYDVFLEEVTIADLLNDHYEALKNWFRSFGTSLDAAVANYCGDRSQIENELDWQTLIREGIDFKALISILGTLILRFQEEPQNSDYFRDALMAVRLYSLLVAIPGSHICQIFNATLYSYVVSVIRVCCEQIDGAVVKNKPVKRKKDGSDVEQEENTNRLQCDKTELISTTNDFLNNLKIIIKNRKLKLDEASLNLTVQLLIMITKLEKVNATLLVYNLNHYRRDTISYIAYKSFIILLDVSKVMNSDLKKSIKLILAELLPIFLMSESRTMGIGGKEGIIIRANYTCFLKLLLNELGEQAHEAINILIQRICVSVPDRAEMRNKATGLAIDILKISPPDLQAKEIHSIIFMSHMPETKTRILTLEMISQLLLDDSIICRNLSESYAAVVNEAFLLAIIFYRCQDISVGIRTKALSYLDQFISCSNKNAKVKKLMDDIFVTPYTDVNDPEQVPHYKKNLFDTQQYLVNQGDYDDVSLDPLPGAKIVLDMLTQFSHEDKVFLKKSSIQLLSRILLSNRLWIRKELLEVFLVGCDDASVLVRKTMCQIITDLVTVYPDHPDVITCWVEGVCPMIAEEEVKAQEKVVEHFSKVILNNIMLYSQTTFVVSRLPWLVIKEILKQNKRSYLHFAVSKWVQNNLARPKIIHVIYSHLDTENNEAAWCLLLSFSQLMNLPNSELIYQQYEQIKRNWNTVSHSQLVLETLYHVCAKMPVEVKENLLREIENDLMECRIPLKLIARSRDICERLVIDGADKRTSHAAVKEWSTPKIMNCMNYIETQISLESPMDVVDETKLMNYIFLLGELAQPNPKHVSKSMIKLLLNVLIAPKKRANDMWKGRVTTSLKAVAILTLVKLSLQKEETASSIMPIFREILSSDSVSPSIQVNAIIGMCDLCSRYTTLVERYFTCICKCFNSPHECVRKTALVSLIKRIKEEYVKLRPFILFPMITMILDKSVDIKRTIATFIGVDLKKKNNVLETFYSGLFFFLNNCKSHSTTVKIPDEIRTMFSYTTKPKIREYIYIYVLDKLADTSRRLLVTKKIINDILTSVADEVLPLDEKTEDILTDAFKMLIDNEKKIANTISKKRSNNEDEEEIEDSEASQAKKAHGHVVANITEGLRVNEIAEAMPIILKLKTKLKKEKSKCSKDLVLFMCELMKHYKEEMSELLLGDMELKAEVDYTLKRMELEQQRQRSSDEFNENTDPDEDIVPQISPQQVEELNQHLRNIVVNLERCDDLVPDLLKKVIERKKSEDIQEPQESQEPEREAEMEVGENNASCSTNDNEEDNSMSTDETE